MTRRPPDDPREREVWWLRRALRHCKRWGRSTPARSSRSAAFVAAWNGTRGWTTYRSDYGYARWLPEQLRGLNVKQLGARLAELEGEAGP